ncbi:MAG: transcriptional regulator, partial [Halobacteria archaeon]|nr:transcriptional regulator [Halobacteria archaeon]
LSDECDIPLSTLYRKLERLSELSLLVESVEMRTDGKHTTRYESGFEDISIGMNDEREFEIEVSRTETADERLAGMWREVSKEI